MFEFVSALSMQEAVLSNAGILLVLLSALGNSSEITPRLLFSGLALVQVLCRVENHSCGRAGILLLVYILRTVIPDRCCRRMTRTTYFFSLTVKG